MNAPWESVTPASLAQRSMWAFALRYRAAHLNEMVIPWHVRGALDHGTLQDALTDLTRRHPTLRARLSYQHGQLNQVVMPAQPVQLQVSTIEGATPEARLQAAMVEINRGARGRIDILSGPTLIARLFRLGDADHVLCLCVHHAMCDGWSIEIILRDLVAFYQARITGLACELPPLIEQYSDAARREASTDTAEGFSEEIRYWQSELANLPSPVALPTIASRKGNRDWRAGEISSQRPVAFMNALRELARQQRASPFAVSLTALAVVLRHRTGSEDQLIGVPTLNRWTEESMQFVGYATSLMPLRVRPEGGMQFSILCKRINTSLREMLAYGRVPLEVLLRETALAPLGNNVFPIWCQYLNSRSSIAFESTGLSFEPMGTERISLLAELDVDLTVRQDGWLCDMAYRKSLFDAGMMQSLMADYIATLEHVMQDPTQPLTELARRLGGPEAAS